MIIYIYKPVATATASVTMCHSGPVLYTLVYLMKDVVVEFLPCLKHLATDRSFFDACCS